MGEETSHQSQERRPLRKGKTAALDTAERTGRLRNEKRVLQLSRRNQE